MADFTGRDPSMELAWRAAEHLGRVPRLPAFLQADTLRKANARRAVFFMEVENPIEEEIEPIREQEIAPQLLIGAVTNESDYEHLIGIARTGFGGSLGPRPCHR